MSTGRRATGSVVGMVILLTTACNITDPDGPSQLGLEVLPQLYTAGGTSGSSEIGIPATNSAEDNFGSIAAFELTTASRFDYAEVVVTGTVASEDAGYCDPPIGPIGTWGPFGTSGGDLRVAITTDPYIGGLSTVGHGTNIMTVGFGVPGDLSIQAGRVGVIAGCTAGPGLSLSGTQSIEYEIYPYFSVTASPGFVPAGDTVTFTASSHWPTSSETWRWRGNDTTSTPGAGADPPAWVCGASSTCKLAPGKSGRLWRYGIFPNGSAYEMPGPIVWVGNPPPLDLELSATSSSVTRGDLVELSVRNLGAGGELNAADLVWKFLPDSVQYYPNANSIKFSPDSILWDPPSPDSVWSGPLVHPGRVIVTGVQGGAQYADTLTVSVTERVFAAPQATLDTAAYNTYFLAIPEEQDSSFTAGLLHLVPANAPSSAFFTAPAPLTDSVTSGPNTGYHWVTQSHLQMNRAYSLNQWIDPPGDPRYTNNKGWLSTTEYLISTGDSIDMMNYRANLIQHERGPSPDSHFERVNTGALQDAGCGHVNAAFERLVASSAFDLNNEITGAWNRASISITYLAGHWYVWGHQSPPYAVAEWTSSRPGVVSSASRIEDAQVNDKPPPPTQYCDVSGI